MATFRRSFLLGLPGLAGLGALVMAVATGVAIPRAHAANIIQIADNPTSCGGSVLCSTNGTLGYSGNVAFDLSTITQWFQIDSCSGSNSNCSPVGGTSLLAGQPAQTMNAGQFLVVNDTGKTVTSLSLTLNDSFTSTTSGVTTGMGSSNNNGACGVASLCMNFQIHTGALGTGFTSDNLTGADCVTSCGTNSANFTLGQVTYNWSGGNIAAGATFDITFASWNNDISAVTAVPEPSTWAMMLLGFAGLGFVASRRRQKSSTAVAIA